MSRLRTQTFAPPSIVTPDTATVKAFLTRRARAGEIGAVRINGAQLCGRNGVVCAGVLARLNRALVETALAEESWMIGKAAATAAPTVETRR